MNTKIILGRILQKLIDHGYCQVDGYKRFKLQSYDKIKVVLIRENGNEAIIPYQKLEVLIDHYKMNPDDYDSGPTKTRDYGLTHINSPLWSLAHLLDKSDYLI